jgi:HD-GYP domain-containing protein (c-di-GMP phosphodiesterase class II)
MLTGASVSLKSAPMMTGGFVTEHTSIKTLRTISFFSNMTDSDLNRIAGIMAEKHYETGAVIIEEKTEAERFFIILQGKIEISKRFEGGDKAVLSIQSDGDFFGEMAILDEGRRSATVSALEPTDVLEIHKDDFDALLYKAPVLAYRILRELSSRLRETGALLISLLTEKNKQLYRAYIDTMTMMVQAAEEQGSAAHGHTGRVTELCMLVGKALSLGEDDLLALELSSLLHDLGMLLVPGKVQDKPGPLDEDEYNLVKQHTLKGTGMIAKIPMLQRIVPFIRHHHEHFDGSGYPDGLAGTDIPLPSRILAVVDAYAAMVFDKPYRRGYSEEKTLDELRKHSGTQFDPWVSDVFMQVLKERGDISVS